MEAIQRKERYTYADYESWGEDSPRCELIDGVIYLMSAPTRAHQWIIGALHASLYAFLRGKACEVYMAPFDVRLNYDTTDDTVVQPDVLVVCDTSKLENGKNLLGAPDFIIEVLSPTNTKHDTVKKLNKYEKAGVREYWIVDPEDKIVVAHRLVDKVYATTTYVEGDTVPVMVLEGFTINLSEVFPEW